jgi:membrane peptidoglycan carboxypeptidase
MLIQERNRNRPKLRIGLKRYLLSLNRDLDRIKADIATNYDYGRYFSHSIYADAKELTTLESTILYMEDKRYFIHSGVEVRSIARGLRRLIRRGSIGGISTIEQQVVRISLGRHEKTFARKFSELILAFCLNLHKPKRQIFDYYIHNAYLGYKMEGCEIAARKAFGISAKNLDGPQSAFVASLLPLPFPRSVWEEYHKSQSYPCSDPSFIISIGETAAPRWASRMKYRMKIAEKGYDFIPNNL